MKSLSNTELNILKVLTGLTSFCGIFGNLICFLIFSRKKLSRIPTSFYYKAIVITDCFILLNELQYFVYSVSYFDLKSVSDLSCKLIRYLKFSAKATSPWIMVYIFCITFISIKYFKKFVHAAKCLINNVLNTVLRVFF